MEKLFSVTVSKFKASSKYIRRHFKVTAYPAYKVNMIRYQVNTLKRSLTINRKSYNVEIPLQYRVTHQVVPKLLIQGRYDCYIGPE